MDSREAARYRDKVINTLIDFWPLVDRTITASNRDKAESFVWRSLKADETAKIADSILELAQSNGQLARIIRGSTLVHDSYGTATIVAIAVWQTVQHFLNHGGIVLPDMSILAGVNHAN